MQADSSTEIATAICRTCQQEKQLAEFSRRGTMGKRRTECRACDGKRQRKYHADIMAGKRVPIGCPAPAPPGMRRCSKCGEVKLPASFSMLITERGEASLQSWCTQCHSEAHREMRLRNLAQPPLANAKKCSTCGFVKPPEEFRKALSKKDGRTARCSVCHVSAKKKAWALLTPQERSFRARKRTYWNFYRLTVDQVDAMIAAQGGVCGICGGPMAHPHVDHCHETRAIRGVLCAGCNTKLAAVDRKNFLTRAFAYLGKNYGNGAVAPERLPGDPTKGRYARRSTVVA